ncbi:hypothetical protein F511_34168 [Dorcoceras hygrometricum]|uniref:Uncharacterized protein n=1 Tax=Dorcoceras hygrometricum TaxID=472368 RepID=A0A2Z7DJQ2_9LAMI|nr:hypothetical protein F511_34168 [Dorcoceras hygrometricum]
MHENKAITESREPKDLNSCSTNESDQLNNSGHGVCEYMGATDSSPHTPPDAKHSSTFCCPTHEVWELPTPLIVANQQGDKVYGSYPLVLKTSILVRTDQYNKERLKQIRAQYVICVYEKDKMSNTEHIQRCKAYTTARIITHAQSKAVNQAHIRTSSVLSENYHKAVPSNTDLTPTKPTTDTSSGIVAQKALNEGQDIARSVRLSEEVTRVSQHFGVLTIISADGLRAADRYDDVGVT